MQIMDKLGVHGKLPRHGDFVSRQLPQGFIVAWDTWLQRALATSQALLGSRWLDIYLTSPIWWFVLSAGVVDARVWAGLMLPSVDRVGRYYPLTLAQPFAAGVSPPQLQIEHSDWFGELERVALAGLQDGVTIDEFEQMLAQIQLPQGLMEVTPATWESGRPLAMFLQQPGQNPVSSLPLLQHSFLLQRFPGYSLWWTAGSERVSPASLISANLPPPQSFTSLLAGDWEQRGWAMPFPAVAPLAFPSLEPFDTIRNE